MQDHDGILQALCQMVCLRKIKGIILLIVEPRELRMNQLAL
jgi:hypothetical protein